MTPGETDEGKNIFIVAMDVMVLDLFYIKGFMTLYLVTCNKNITNTDYIMIIFVPYTPIANKNTVH